MSVALFRVDERLIHGQVVVGWGRRLHPRRIVVVHDGLAGSPVEQEIYRTGLPDDIEASFWSEAEAIERLPETIASAEPAFVLTEDLATMQRIVEAGVAIDEVNVGGLHAGPGRVGVLPYVFLDPDDAGRIRALEHAGVKVTARDVPGAEPVRLVRRTP